MRLREISGLPRPPSSVVASGFDLSLPHITVLAPKPYGALSVSAAKGFEPGTGESGHFSKNKNEGQSLSYEEKMKEVGVFD